VLQRVNGMARACVRTDYRPVELVVGSKSERTDTTLCRRTMPRPGSRALPVTVVMGSGALEVRATAYGRSNRDPERRASTPAAATGPTYLARAAQYPEVAEALAINGQG